MSKNITHKRTTFIPKPFFFIIALFWYLGETFCGVKVTFYPDIVEPRERSQKLRMHILVKEYIKNLYPQRVIPISPAIVSPICTTFRAKLNVKNEGSTFFVVDRSSHMTHRCDQHNKSYDCVKFGVFWNCIRCTGYQNVLNSRDFSPKSVRFAMSFLSKTT